MQAGLPASHNPFLKNTRRPAPRKPHQIREVCCASFCTEGNAVEGEWVARCLEALGHEAIVADPNFAPMYVHRNRKIKPGGCTRPRRGVCSAPSARPIACQIRQTNSWVKSG